MHRKSSFIGKRKKNFVRLQLYLLYGCLNFSLSVWICKQKVNGVLEINMGKTQMPRLNRKEGFLLTGRSTHFIYGYIIDEQNNHQNCILKINYIDSDVAKI